eukprot:10302851-Karenia_brevis.AAC.1
MHILRGKAFDIPSYCVYCAAGQLRRRGLVYFEQGRIRNCKRFHYKQMLQRSGPASSRDDPAAVAAA